MGIKERVESGKRIKCSQAKDILWFTGIVLSGIIIWLLVFMGQGISQAFVFPLVLSAIWSFSLLLFKPIPLYSVALAVLCAALLLYN